MRHSSLRQYEGASRGVNPAIPNQKAHRSLNHIENVVLSVGVCAGALRVRLQAPLGDGIRSLCFVPVRFEDSANAPHRVRTPGAGEQKNAGSFCRVVLDAHVSSYCLLLEECGKALPYLFRRHIFLTSRDEPNVAERVFQFAVAVAVELVVCWLQYFRPAVESPANHCVRVFDVKVNLHRRSAAINILLCAKSLRSRSRCTPWAAQSRFAQCAAPKLRAARGTRLRFARARPPSQACSNRCR